MYDSRELNELLLIFHDMVKGCCIKFCLTWVLWKLRGWEWPPWTNYQFMETEKFKIQPRVNLCKAPIPFNFIKARLIFDSRSRMTIWFYSNGRRNSKNDVTQTWWSPAEHEYVGYYHDPSRIEFESIIYPVKIPSPGPRRVCYPHFII